MNAFLMTLAVMVTGLFFMMPVSETFGKSLWDMVRKGFTLCKELLSFGLKKYNPD